MTEILTGKQVLALLALRAQDKVSEIETRPNASWDWVELAHDMELSLFFSKAQFRIKPTPARRISVTLANGEVVSWPEPVREALTMGQEYWIVGDDGSVEVCEWTNHSVDKKLLAFGNVHLTKEAAQEHADALRKINTQIA